MTRPGVIPGSNWLSLLVDGPLEWSTKVNRCCNKSSVRLGSLGFAWIFAPIWANLSQTSRRAPELWGALFSSGSGAGTTCSRNSVSVSETAFVGGRKWGLSGNMLAPASCSPPSINLSTALWASLAILRYGSVPNAARISAVGICVALCLAAGVSSLCFGSCPRTIVSVMDPGPCTTVSVIDRVSAISASICPDLPATSRKPAWLIPRNLWPTWKGTSGERLCGSPIRSWVVLFCTGKLGGAVLVLVSVSKGAS